MTPGHSISTSRCFPTNHPICSDGCKATGTCILYHQAHTVRHKGCASCGAGFSPCVFSKRLAKTLRFRQRENLQPALSCWYGNISCCMSQVKQYVWIASLGRTRVVQGQATAGTPHQQTVFCVCALAGHTVTQSLPSIGRLVSDLPCWAPAPYQGEPIPLLLRSRKHGIHHSQNGSHTACLLIRSVDVPAHACQNGWNTNLNVCPHQSISTPNLTIFL